MFNFVLVASIFCTVSAAEWNYDSFSPQGPAHWAETFPAGNGQMQSPINIKTSSRHMKSGADLLPLKFDYTPSTTTFIIQSHFTFTMFFDERFTNELSGGALGAERYQLAQIHPHWGGTDRRGSEHAIDQKLYSAELHLVHYNRAKYGDINEALKHPDGLAVIGILIKLGKHNAEFEKILQVLPEQEGNLTRLPSHFNFDLEKLLPDSCRCYYAYRGSLTAPPLLEIVIWHVLNDPIEISVEQLHHLRAQYCRNYRPIQRQHSRTIISSCMDDRSDYYSDEFYEDYSDFYSDFQGAAFDSRVAYEDIFGNRRRRRL